MLFDCLAGYALARIPFRGRSVVFATLIAVMAVPNVVLLIPKFLVINELRLYDSYAALILPLLVDAAGVFIMKNFFESIPVSVEEQARIDGAGTLPDLLVDRAADGAARGDDDRDPVVPGLVERAEPLHRREQRARTSTR